MKKLKFLSIFLIFCLVTACLPARALALESPPVESRAAVVMDRNTGEVFFSQNAEERVYPASITKIMTVLLAVEAIEDGLVSAGEEVTASAHISYDLIPDGSSAGIVSGESMPLVNLLYCAMVSSANEACNAIAEHVGGSIPEFIARMNARAAELGCAHTHFANTHGLPDENHYTTASDFCRIAMEAASHELFMQIADTSSIEIPATNVSGVRKLNNSNALICADSIYGSGYLYPDAHGIKTGYTSAAGYCLVSTAERDGIELLAAVFGGEGNDAGRYTNFTDSITLYDWVFDNYSYQQVLDPNVNIASVDVSLGRDSDYVNLRPAGAVTLLLPNDYDASEFDYDMQVYSLQQGERVTAPVTAGEVLGEVSVLRAGQNCGTVKLVAASTVDLSRSQYIRTHIRETIHTAIFRWIFWSAVLILVLYLAWVILYRVRRIQYKRAVNARRGGSHARPRQAEDTAAQEPEIEFFSGESEPAAIGAAGSETPRPQPVSDDTVVVPRPAEPQTGTPRTAQKSEDAASPFHSKADRDYFEEFFRQK